MNHWFRFYHEVVTDPKVQRLPAESFKAWVNLLCLASKNGGVLPCLDDVAYYLRLSVDEASELLDLLCSKGLFDPIEVEDAPMSYEPHNWKSRQFKSDVSTTRVKRFRERQRNVSETPPEQSRAEQTREEVAVAEDARAKPNPGKSGQEAHDLAEQLLEIAGHSRHAWPPGWCGAPLRVKAWFGQGWQPEIILSAVRACMARRQGSPVSSVQFFEKAIAEEHARQAAPVPKVEIRQAETITVTHGTSKSRSGGSLIDAIKRERASVEAQIADLEMSGNVVLSIPDRSVRRS